MIQQLLYLPSSNSSRGEKEEFAGFHDYPGMILIT